MYVDEERVKPDTPVPLVNGNKICFGINMDNNDLKYKLECNEEAKSAILRRCGVTESKDETLLISSTPPTVKGKRGLCEDGDVSASKSVPKKKPRLSSEEKDSCSKTNVRTSLEREGVNSKSVPKKNSRLSSEKKDSCSKTNVRTSLEREGVNSKSVPKKNSRLSSEKKDSCSKTNVRTSLEREGVNVEPVEKDSTTPLSKPTSSSTLSVPTSSITTTPKSSPILNLCSSSTKPSPALSTRSIASDIDELFDGGETETIIMEDAIFGEASRNTDDKVFEERRQMDATTLQIQLAKKQMDEENKKLLSSIEALKSELAAKDQLLANNEEKTKAAESAGNSVVSSMQEEFTCVICQELFIIAYTLPCAHSFCEWCIKEWMKRKGHKDCPICRKKITTDPVHSLALDNAVSKLVEKLSPDEQKERKETETTHKEALANLEPTRRKQTAIRTSGPTTRTATATRASGPASRASVGRSSAAATLSRTDASGTVVIDLSSGRPTIITDPIVLDTSTESESDSDTSSDSDTDSDESDSSDSGLLGEYYGGYGRCFICGEL